MTATTKVTRKYQVTIPREVRVRKGIKVGDKFQVKEKGELIVLQKVNQEKSIRGFAGCWEGYPEDPEKFMKDLRKMWSAWKP